MTGSSGFPPAAKRGRGILKAFLVLILLVGAFLGGAYFGDRLGLFGGGGTPPPTKLIVGTNTPFPPFESRNSTSDEIEGFDIDLITEILDRMGYVRGTEWDLWDFRDFTGGLLAAVQAGRVDIAVSAITITDARNGTMDFTDSYYESDQGVLMRAGDARNWCADDSDCQPADIDAAGGAAYDVAVQQGTTSDCWVTPSCWESTNLANATVQRFPDVSQVLIALQTSAVDIVIIDRPVAARIAQANPGTFAVGGTIQTNELYGFAVANNDPLALVSRMNQALAAIKSDGTYATIEARWF